MQCIFTSEPQWKGMEHCLWENRVGHWKGGRHEHGFICKVDPRMSCVCACVCVSVHRCF